MASKGLNETGLEHLIGKIKKQTTLSKSASGRSLVANDAASLPLRTLDVYGECVQDGTPAPDSPVHIQAVRALNMFPEQFALTTPYYTVPDFQDAGLRVSQSAYGGCTFINGLSVNGTEEIDGRTLTKTLTKFYATTATSANLRVHLNVSGSTNVVFGGVKTLTVGAYFKVTGDNATGEVRIIPRNASGNIATYSETITKGVWTFVSHTFTVASDLALQDVLLFAMTNTSGSTTSYIQVETAGILFAFGEADGYIPPNHIAVTSCGKNLLNPKSYIDGFLTGGTALGAKDATRKEHTSPYIPVIPGEDLCFQVWVTPTTGANEYLWMAYQFFNSEKALVGTRPSQTKGANTGTLQHATYTMQVPSSAAYIRVSARLYSDGLMQLERGSTATDYEPYTANTSYLDIQGVELYGLDSTYRDVLRIDSSGHAVVEKRVGKIVYDGSQSWVNAPADASAWNYRITPTDILSSYKGQSSIYELLKSDRGYPGNAVSTQSGNAGRMWCRFTQIHIVPSATWAGDNTDAAAWKTFLASNPLTMLYPLDQDCFKSIDLGYIDLPELSDGSTVSVAAEIQPAIGGTWWTEPGEDIGELAAATCDSAIGLSKYTVPFIEQTNATANDTWTGNAPFASLRDGQEIDFWKTLNWANSGTTNTTNYWSQNGCALNLTLSTGETTGPIPIFYNGTSRLTSHYQAGSLIQMVYKENYLHPGYAESHRVAKAWYCKASYNSDTLYSRSISGGIYTGANGILSYGLCMKDTNGRWTAIVNNKYSNTTQDKIPYTGGLELGEVLYASTWYSNGRITTDNTSISGDFWSSYILDFRFCTNISANSTAGKALTVRQPVYLVGTVNSSGYFVLDPTQWWTQTATDATKVYIYLGVAYSWYQLALVDIKPIYVYDGSKLVNYHDKAHTSSVVMPNDHGHVKTRFRIAKTDYTGSGTTDWYYPIAQLPADNSSNYASLIISGRIGGWVSDNMSYVNALVWNRSGTGIALMDIAGAASSMAAVWGPCEIVVYTDADATTDTVYLRARSYFTFDIDIELFQSTATILYDGTYLTTEPTGTLQARSSTTTKRVEIVNGKILVNGTDLSVVSNLSGTLGVAHGGTGKTTGVDAANYFLNELTTGSSDPSDNDYYISQYASGGTTTTTYHRRPVSKLWNYIKSKISSVIGLTTTSDNGVYQRHANVTVKTGSTAQSHISLQTLMTWLITTKQYIPSNVYSHVVLNVEWSYAGNDILQFTAGGVSYELQLAGCVIEFMGNATSYNAGVFRLRIHSAPANSFTAASGYTKFPLNSIAEYTCNGSGYSPTWVVYKGNTVNDAGTGLSKSGTTLNHSNSVTAGTAGTSSATSGTNTLAVPYVTYDAQGHVTASGTHTHTIGDASTSAKGVTQLSSATDSTSEALAATPKAVSSALAAAKTYADGKNNQNAFSNVKVGSTTVAADTTTDTLELAGSNVTLTPDATNDKVTIGITASNVTTALGNTAVARATADASGNSIASTYANQNAFSNVKVGSTTVAADTTTDTLELVAGTNVTLTPDATNDKVTIAATDTTYSAGTGISLSGTTFSNSGVRSVATGTDKGSVSVNTNGTASNVYVKGLEKGYINTHPENGPLLLPFIHNDIAFLLYRGGSAVVTKDGEVWNTSIGSVFDGSPTYWAITHTGITTIVFELTLQMTFSWTNTIYVDFGPWWTRSVKIEVMNSNYENDSWTTEFDDTNNTSSHVFTTFSYTPTGASSAGGGFNKIRLTFSDFVHGYSSTMFRISQIGVYNYASNGVRNTYMSRGIDDYVFRSITPYAADTYSLGGSSNRWKYVYTEQLSASNTTGTLAIGAHTQSSVANAGIKVNDVRNASITNNAMDSAANFFFTNSGTPNTEWWSILHVRGWKGAYAAWELAGTAHDADRRTAPLYVRTGSTTNTWGSWRKIYDDANKPTTSEIGAVAKSGDTMTGNLIVPRARIANTYYGVSFDRTTGTPVETILYTGIKWVNGVHMPVIHVTGYAYGLYSPVEFKIAFYIYSGKIGWCGATNMGSWNPTLYGFKYTRDSVDYVAIGFSGSCYFLQLQADVQDEMGKFGNIDLSSAAWSWSFLTTAGTIPAADGGTTCIQIPYKADILVPKVANATGTLAIANGGTGATTADAAWTALGGGAIGKKASLAASDIPNLSTDKLTSGTLGVARGGTGKATHTSNAVLTGNGTSAVNNVATASGAFYATAANGAPSFGTLPVAQGGTGQTTLAAARNSMGLGNTTGALPIANGGTGKTSAADARTALGVPPTSHASSATTYGTGTDANYGHLKLSGATNSNSGTSGGIAATPSAVKSAYDLANTANGTANSALSAAQGALVFDTTYTISGSTATFSAHVYQCGSEITSTLQDSQFTWYYRIGTTASTVSLGTGKTKAVTITTLGYGGHVGCTFDDGN